ncbi:hypothetical protein K9L16_02320 [Candidatus Pacearchaeota archaeon]|nr:hypothetical protein [Candidatus Pacearchaeota archaeon]
MKQHLRKIEVGILLGVLIINLFLVFFLFKGGITSYVVLSDNGKVPKALPSNFLNKTQIFADSEKVCLYIEDARLSEYTDSSSMLPVLGKNSTGINLKPASADEIHVGDIISFRNKQGEIFVHRVIEKGLDSQGVYFITKGDNNLFDDGKVYFEEIDSVLIGIIY